MSQNHHHPINPRKALFCSRSFLQKPIISQDQQHCRFPNEANLLKYFPKYIHKLIIGSNNYRLTSKVKRVKILHAFQDSPSQYQNKNLRRTLLYNKEKHIQLFYDEPYGYRLLFRSPTYLIQGIKAFTGLQSLRLLSNRHEPKGLPCLKIFCIYMQSLTKLKHLKADMLDLDTERYLSAISRVNSHERMLGSLETLEIKCALDFEALEDIISLLRGLLKNKNILKYTTHLNLGSFYNQTLLELLQDLLTCCPKLVSLRLQVVKPNPKHEENSSLEFVPQYPQAFGNLTNLQTVKIICMDTLNLLSNFALPPSVQNVDLSLLPFEPSMFQHDSKNENLPQVLMTFCEKWSHLTNLNTLKIEIGQYNDPGGILTLLFVQSWLKRVNGLQNLSVDFSADILNKSNSRTGDLDISDFLESIQHSKDTLQSLAILDTRKIYNLKNPPKQPFEFPHLHKLSLGGFMYQHEPLVQKLFHTNLKDLLMAGSNQKPFEVFLDGLMFDTQAGFLNFIQSFDHERNDQQRALKVEIVAYLSETSNPFACNYGNVFALVSNGLIRIDVKVSWRGEIKPNDDPKSRLENSLQVLKFVD